MNNLASNTTFTVTYYSCYSVATMNLTYKTTHEAFGFVLIIAQCFATFPLSGILSNNIESLKLSFKDARFYYCLLYLLLLLVNMTFYAMKIFNEVEFGYFVSFLFFTCSFVTTIIFLIIAKEWPKMIKFWTKVDLAMETRGYGFPKKLQRKLWIITAFVLLGAILEHSFFLSYASSNIPSNGMEAVNDFLKAVHEHLFRYFPYSFPLGLLFQLISVFSTFTWNYMDLFVMVISVALADRFEQVSNRISHAIAMNVVQVEFWKKIREDYNRLGVLCKKIDLAIGDLILLSFANNIFVILVQLVNTLEPKSNNDIIGRLYFICSFGFLIFRTLLVCLSASGVYEQSQSSLGELSCLPNSCYNIEMDRLLNQIKEDPCCLSGRKLFYVNKSLILSIAGAIVTYELILIQFNVN